ncbi:hypothetical protein SEA_AEGEUS_108 [Mycobacterium phage Aegeus]|nr:hypothetical protein SEA_BAUDELAIRE_108 [Mycobacterium phage Baudelaire]WKW86600.1 hypothetical protein SEA_AEGEUS_108 [Mycobacterium phage Aegeus]
MIEAELYEHADEIPWDCGYPCNCDCGCDCACVCGCDDY